MRRMARFQDMHSHAGAWERGKKSHIFHAVDGAPSRFFLSLKLKPLGAYLALHFI